MSETSDEITRLSQIWYEYVNLDYHKDRDCHFAIETTYSYGDKPTFTAYHNGYIAERWHSPRRDTYDEAERDLLGLIRRQLNEAYAWAKRDIESNDGSYDYDTAIAAMKILDDALGA